MRKAMKNNSIQEKTTTIDQQWDNQSTIKHTYINQIQSKSIKTNQNQTTWIKINRNQANKDITSKTNSCKYYENTTRIRWEKQWKTIQSKKKQPQSINNETNI